MPKLGDGITGKPPFGPSVLPILSYSLNSLAQFKHNYCYFELGLIFLSDFSPHHTNGIWPKASEVLLCGSLQILINKDHWPETVMRGEGNSQFICFESQLSTHIFCIFCAGLSRVYNLKLRTLYIRPQTACSLCHHRLLFQLFSILLNANVIDCHRLCTKNASS